MLVLGVTSNDKGAQLQGLVGRVLVQQGYADVRLNVVGAGGNEVDVSAERRSPIMGQTQVTPLMCEAKAYAGPLDMPTWQRFLGKLLIARTDNQSRVGLLIALNGVNGNVAGSHAALKRTDQALFVMEGAALVKNAASRREISEQDEVRARVEESYRRVPSRLDAAYYGGAFYWVATWNSDEYSVVDGHGRMLPSEDVERLRPALEPAFTGSLLASDEARAEAEARHHARLVVMDRLFRGHSVLLEQQGDQQDAAAALTEEPFTRSHGGRLALARPSELDAASAARLFLSLFDEAVKVQMLSFMIGGHHRPYVDRLVELLPDIQSGFTLDLKDLQTLRALAVPFPSVWAVLATENPMITTHRAGQAVSDEATQASDRAALWERVFAAIRNDYSNPRLHGFLYDHLDVAELEEHEQLHVKTKQGPLGQPVRIEKRTAVRQFTADHISEDSGPIYVSVRMLPAVAQPWDDVHREPVFPLDPDDGLATPQ